MTYQRFLGQPRFEQPLVGDDGRVSPAWLNWITSVHQALGFGRLNVGLSTFAQQVGGGGRPVALNDCARGGLIGNLAFLDTPGALGVGQVGASPFTFTATTDGLFLTSGGTLQMSRQGVVHPVAGGSLPLTPGDSAIVTWSGGAPTMTWLPRGN